MWFEQLIKQFFKRTSDLLPCEYSQYFGNIFILLFTEVLFQNWYKSVVHSLFYLC